MTTSLFGFPSPFRHSANASIQRSMTAAAAASSIEPVSRSPASSSASIAAISSPNDRTARRAYHSAIRAVRVSSDRFLGAISAQNSSSVISSSIGRVATPMMEGARGAVHRLVRPTRGIAA
ncbi:hypothetical protein KPL78_19020 [Roseomonas sp. HJA6]|uniref:Uncharacterized protein n=1 Tax=Roseomonas alba TaxID=2846776 RepID=A0ABS7AD26_9PROT|nr:hypothetical protein [Neoroseomonas alba]